MTLERIANRRENVSIFNESICSKYDKLELAFSIRKQFRDDNLGKNTQTEWVKISWDIIYIQSI